MTLLLSSQNVADYLFLLGVCTQEEQNQIQIELVAAKNFNLFAIQESFGMNRCQIVANGLLEACHQRDDSPKGRMNAILQHFSFLGIDWQRSYLNANSEDIYTPLNLC